MSKVDLFLSRLDGVKQTRPGRWKAKCPAHDDKNPSLIVTELDDGRTLLHCFSGCPPDEVLSAVGMTFADLHPAPLGHRFAPERRAIPASDVLRALCHEVLVVAAGAVKVLPEGHPDRERLILAAERLQAGARMAGVAP
jgi:hypothetical protein